MGINDYLITNKGILSGLFCLTFFFLPCFLHVLRDLEDTTASYYISLIQNRRQKESAHSEGHWGTRMT